MTRLYEFTNFPHCIDIICPACRHRAEFEFGETVQIKLKSDVTFFQDSRLFEYWKFTDHCGHHWHGAVYFQGLHGSPRQTIGALPAGYSAEDWDHPPYVRSRSEWPIGAFRCTYCPARRIHLLKWPSDAFFSISYRNHVLWAYHRESTIALMEYLTSSKRNIWGHGWAPFLLHVPTIFKVRKARDPVVKQLAALLKPECGQRRSI